MTEIAKDFLLGSATAAYQIEGAATEDGRGASIWDVFSHTPGRVFGGDTGDVACDHYHRFQDDVALMNELGLDAYRFSIAWPRLFWSGSGSVNQKGLDFYRRLTEALLDAGIQPWVTLYHWDLPQTLEDKGGWANRDTALRFGEYAHTVFARLGDLIPNFITVNEPFCSAVLGYVLGEHAPGRQDIMAGMAASHHLLLAHGKAVEAFRSENLSGSQIGITNIVSLARPATDTLDDEAAAERVNDLTNRWFLSPVLKGVYPDSLRERGIDTLVQPLDMQTISQPIDFVGVNYYRTTIARNDPSDMMLGAAMEESGVARTDMGWGVDAPGLYDSLQWIRREYGDIPLYITENGAAYQDFLDNRQKGGKQVHDRERTRYIKEHLEQVLRAKADGVDVRGYFLWSLMDNYEWAFGYSKRFGIVYVDFETQERIWKDSAKWYQGVIRDRRI